MYHRKRLKFCGKTTNFPISENEGDTTIINYRALDKFSRNSAINYKQLTKIENLQQHVKSHRG
jgi:hypothetical protein